MYTNYLDHNGGSSVRQKKGQKKRSVADRLWLFKNWQNDCEKFRSFNFIPLKFKWQS